MSTNKVATSTPSEQPSDAKQTDKTCAFCNSILSVPQTMSCCQRQSCLKCSKEQPCSNCNKTKKKSLNDEVGTGSEEECSKYIEGGMLFDCMNSRNGCKWKGKMSNMAKHMKGECQFGFEGSKTEKNTKVLVHAEEKYDDDDYEMMDLSHTNSSADLSLNVHDNVNNSCPYSIVGCSHTFKHGEVVQQLQHMRQFEYRHEWMKNSFAVYLSHLENTVQKKQKQLRMKNKDIVHLKTQVIQAMEGEEKLAKQLAKERKSMKALEMVLQEKNEELASLQRHIATSSTQYPESIEQKNDTRVIQKLMQFQMKNFSKCHTTETRDKWTSDSFYTHTNGYRMCFEVGCPSDSIQICMYILPSEHDENLPWPLRGSITVTVRNHVSDTNHHDYVFIYNDNTPLAVCGRVKQSESRSDKCISMSPQLKIDRVTQSASKEVQYTVDDTLVFEVTSVDLDGQVYL